jgi:tripartite-type tricarboxylate transporter receptor subunit TctC
MLNRRHLLACVTAVVTALTVGVSAHAQAYPSKPVNIIVPFAAGGPTDTVARQLAEGLRKPLGQPIVIENVAGAGGTLGTARVAKAPNDGHTLLLMHIGFSTAPSLYRKLSYNWEQDFEPIGLIVDVPMTMIARSDFPASNFQEFVTYVKANKDKLSMANAGIGAASHLCGLLFQSAIGTELTTIPYRGTGPAMTDIMGKQVDFMCDQTTNTTTQIKAGTVKAYAVTSNARVGTLPDLPTMSEAGLRGFQVGVWHGLWAPKGTPKPVIDKLVASLQEAMADPAFVKRMNELGAQVYPKDKATPAALQSHVKSEVAKWGEVIRKAGVYAD